MDNMGLKPLEVFGTSSYDDPDLLLSLADRLASPAIEAVCRYLDQPENLTVKIGTSWMCDDCIDEARSQSWVTDGVYFWAPAASSYVHRDGTHLPPHIVLHCLRGQGRTDWAQDHKLELEGLVQENQFPILESYSEFPEDPAAEQFPTVEHVDPSRLLVIGDVSSAAPADQQWLTVMTQWPLEPSVRERIIWYLKSCQELIWRAGLDAPERRRRNTDSRAGVYTDGRYVWRGDYAHAVRSHGGQVPDDLLQRALDYEWTQLTPDALETVHKLLRSGELREPSRQWLPG